jgi:hypothetical protein
VEFLPHESRHGRRQLLWCWGGGAVSSGLLGRRLLRGGVAASVRSAPERTGSPPQGFGEQEAVEAGEGGGRRRVRLSSGGKEEASSSWGRRC